VSVEEQREMELIRGRRFGWTSLFVWATAGLVIEALQGFRVERYVNDDLGRTLLRLGHAHGVGLSLVVLVYSSAGIPILKSRKDRGLAVGRLLRLAALLIPIGFVGSAIHHPEGDPSLVVLAVPLGGAALVGSLAMLTFYAWRARPGSHGESPD
jgi:hypothetical protein